MKGLPSSSGWIPFIMSVPVRTWEAIHKATTRPRNILCMGSTDVRLDQRGMVMNGSESLVATLVAEGVGICFANPGTSEMHFLAALENPGLRSVLVLFEGIATGAADGWYRMSGYPASTLLHLGPGLANGLANLHNARRAGSGVVNIIGEHATAHLQYDPPLMSDIDGLARPI